MKLKAIGFLFVLLFSSCAAHKTFTQEEWTEVTTREYRGKSAVEVFDAIEKVLRLADNSDVKVYRWPDRLVATRSYFIYAVFSVTSGFFTFDIRAEQGESGTRVTAMITRAEGAMGGVPTAYNPTIITTPSAGGMIVDHPELYELLFSRVKYFLNGGVWITCDRADEIYQESPSATLDGLCLMCDDDLPVELRKPIEGSNSWRERRSRR